jgi:TRAP-type C4-dicarboxylate transport system substrate-binding protein
MTEALIRASLPNVKENGMRKMIALKGIVLLLITVLFAWTGVVQADEVIKLKYSNLFPPAHKNSVLSDQWGKEIEKRTNGRVKVVYLPGNTLTPPTQTYDSVVKGIADVGQSLVAYAPGRFPLTEVLGLPLGYTSGEQATNLCNDYYKKFQPKEFADTKIMYIHGHPPGLFHTKKETNGMDDLKGLRIKVNVENAPIVSAIGAVPVTLPITETYEGLQKGLIDGVILPIEPIKGWKLADVLKTTIINNAMSYTAPIFVTMNKDKWNSLPKDIQEIIEKVNEEWVQKQAKQWDVLNKESEEFAIQKGIKIIKVSPEVQAQTAEKMKPVLEAYVKSMKEKGLPGDEALKFCQDYIKKTNP